MSLSDDDEDDDLPAVLPDFGKTRSSWTRAIVPSRSSRSIGGGGGGGGDSKENRSLTTAIFAETAGPEPILLTSDSDDNKSPAYPEISDEGSPAYPENVDATERQELEERAVVLATKSVRKNAGFHAHETERVRTVDGTARRRDSIDSHSFTILDMPGLNSPTDDEYDKDDDDDLYFGHQADDVIHDSSIVAMTMGGVPSSSVVGSVAGGGMRRNQQCLADEILADSQYPTTAAAAAAQPVAKRKRLTADEREQQRQVKEHSRDTKKAEKEAEKRRKQTERARGKAERQISTEARQASNRDVSLKMMRLVVDSRLWDFPAWSEIFTMLTPSPEESEQAAAAGPIGTATAISSSSSSLSRARSAARGASNTASSNSSNSSGGKARDAASVGFGVVLEEDQLPVANSVRWRRAIVQGAFDEDSQDIVRDMSFKDEEQVVVLWTADEFSRCVLQCDGSDDCLRLAGQSLQDMFPEKQVTLLLVGINAYLGQCKNADNRDFRSAVRRLGDTGAAGGDDGSGVAASGGPKRGGGKQPEAPAVVLTRVKVEDALVSLQMLCPRLRLRQAETSFETARLLFQMTKAIAHDAARKADASPFSFYSEGQALKPVKIDVNGAGCQRAWQQQLRQIHSVGQEKAAAISSTFPSPRNLLSACLACNTDKEVDQLMTNIEIRRGTGVLGRVTHVGKDFGRQLHRFITSRDGEQLIDGSGSRSESQNSAND